MIDITTLFCMKSIKYLLLNIFGKLLQISGVHPLTFAYKLIGVLKYENNDVSGEAYMIDMVVPKHTKSTRPVFFDVGAHVGNYAHLLRKKFANAQIFAFEPNPKTFEQLQRNVANANVRAVNIGLSNEKATTTIYTYGNETDSEHASVYADVMTSLHHDQKPVSFDIELETLDAFCEQHEIQEIDFLKIDTEGHELSVLEGAKRMLSSGKIKLIQFEFNEMNVVSRVFMKDFYSVLPAYSLYRLDSTRLIPLGKYDTFHEIFKFQNIVAIPKSE